MKLQSCIGVFSSDLAGLLWLGGSPLCAVLKTLQPEISGTKSLNGMKNIIVVPAGGVKGDP